MRGKRNDGERKYDKALRKGQEILNPPGDNAEKAIRRRNKGYESL
jgi:hypothetical protein